MGLAETAELLILLGLKDQASAGLARVEGELKGLGATATASQGGITGAGSAMHKASGHAITLGGALGHAKHALTDLLTGPLGMIGLGAGAFGIAEFFKEAVGATYDLGNASIGLQRIIGGTVANASAILAVGEKYGVTYDRLTASAAFYEKTVGKLETTQGKATKGQKEALTKLQEFDKAYGLTLADNTGKAVDYMTALDQMSIAYAKTSDKAKFATEAAQIFGRGFAALLPVFQGVGAKGFAEAAKEAQDLGVALTDKTAADLMKARTAGIAFNEAMQGLKLAIGTQVVPVLTDLQKGITGFLTHGGIKQIRDVVGGIIGTVRQVAGVAGQMASAFNGFWSALPEPLRQLLIGAVIGNKVMKFTFGFSGIDLLKNVLGGGNGLFARGSPGNPMHVVVDGGLGGGGLGGGGKGGLSPLGVAAAGLGGIAIADVFKSQVIDPALTQQNAQITANVAALIRNPSTTRAQLQAALAATQQGAKDIRGQAFGLGGTLWGGQADQLDRDTKAIQQALIRMPVATANENRKHALTKDQVQAAVHEANRDVAARTDIRQMQTAVTFSERQTGQNVASVMRAVGQFLAGTDRSGFAGVVTAVNAVSGAIAGLPAYFGTASAQGRGTAPGGRASASSAAAAASAPVGTEKGRYHYTMHVSVTPRSNDYANRIQSRYGPTAARAGAQ